MEKTMMQKNKIALIAVSLALVACVAYIALNEYQKMRDSEQLSAYQQGASYGYQQAVLQLMQQVSTCQQVPVMYANQTINVIAVECLQQAQGQ